MVRVKLEEMTKKEEAKTQVKSKRYSELSQDKKFFQTKIDFVLYEVQSMKNSLLSDH